MYIGSSPNFGALDSQTITSANGSTATFTLNQYVPDSDSIIVTVGNVVQEPTEAYTASGNSITFTENVPNGDTIVIRYLGRSVDVYTGYKRVQRFKYVATNGQDTFSGSDANSNTLAYTAQDIDIFYNGVRLDESEFTATNGTSVILGTGATTNAELVILAYKVVQLADTVPASTGGTFTGNVVFSGNATVNGNLTASGTTTLVDTTNTVVKDNLLGLNHGASSNSNDAGIIIERGSTGNDALLIWDESADKWALGTTTSNASSTGNLNMTTGTLVANLEGTIQTASQTNITSVGTLGTLKIGSNTKETTTDLELTNEAVIKASSNLFLNGATHNFYTHTSGASTGGIGSSTPRMSIDANGRVAIMDSSNTAIIQNDASNLTVNCDNSGGLLINNIGQTNGEFSKLLFASHATNTAYPKQGIGVKRTGDFGVGDLYISVDSNADANDVDMINDARIIIRQTSEIETYGQTLINGSDSAYAVGDADDLVVGSPSNYANRGITIVSGQYGNSTINFSDANSGDGRRAGHFNYQHQYDEYQLYARNLNELIRFTSAGNLVPTTGYIKQAPSSSGGGQFHNGTNITGYNSGNYNEMGNEVNDIILMLKSYAGTGNKNGLYIGWANEPNNETSKFIQCNSSGGNKAIIYGSGTIRNSTGTYSTFSDERLKSNIVDAKSQWEDIKALKFKNFIKFDNPDLKQLGLIAQDVEKTSPSLVFETPPDTAEIKHKPELGTLYEEEDELPEGRIVGDVKEVKSNVKNVKDSILYMKAVKALQEAMARIETLEAKVEELEKA